MRRAGVLVLLLLAGCISKPPHGHPPPYYPDLSLERLPEVEAFEPILDRKGQLIEALFAIDAMVDGREGLDEARDAYRDLLAKARPLAEAAAETGGVHAAAVEIMGLMRSEGFVYDAARSGWSLRYGSISECLRSKRGICLSFTLLTMALLDSCEMRSWAATYPRHVLVRVWKDGRHVELESTNYGDPVAMHYPEDLADRSARQGFVFCRSLDRVQSCWLYLSERLWGWVLLRYKDNHSFRLLERAELALDGSEESISAQWAIRHQLRTTRPALTAGERAESRRLAVLEYERLIQWNPREGLFYLLLSASYESFGDRRSALLVLQRFMDTGPGLETYWDLFAQARWWIKRQEFDLEEFRMTPEEKKRAEDFMEDHFGDSNPASRLNAEFRRLFESTER